MFLHSSVCTLVALPEVLKKVWKVTVYNCKVKCSKEQNFPPATEVVFDKLVKEQKHNFASFLFFPFFSCEKRKKS